MKKFLFFFVVCVAITGTISPGHAAPGTDAEKYLSEGKDYYRQKEYRAALTCLERALVLYRESKSIREIGETLLTLGRVRSALDDYPGALSSLEESLGFFRDGRDDWGAAESENEIGYVLYLMKRYDEALTHFDRSLEAFRKIRTKVGEGIALSDIGMVHKAKGDYDAALDYYGRALASLREAESHELVLSTLEEIAGIYDRLRRYEKELETYNEALTTAEKIGDESRKARLLFFTGLTYSSLGLHEEAIETYRGSLEAYRKAGDRKGEGYALSCIGSSLNNVERYEEGLDAYRAARKVFEEIGDSTGLGFAIAGMAFSNYFLGHKVRAFLLYAEVKGLTERTESDRDVAGDPLIQGFLSAGMERYREAIPFFEEALAQGIEKSDIYRIGYGAGYLGYCHKALGHDEKAVDYYKTAIDAIESVRGDILTEERKAAFMKSKINVYEDIIELLVGLGRFEEAFDYMERSRSRAFLDMLGTRRLEVTGKRDRELLIRQDEISARLAALAGASWGEAGAPAGAPIRSAPDNPARAIEEVKEEYADLVRTMKAENPELASLVTVTPLTLPEVKAVTPPDTRIIEYFTTNGAAYIFSLSHEGLSVRTVPIARGELAKKVTALRESIRSSLASKDTSDFKKRSRELYDLLISPIAREMTEKRLIIIPHGPLHYLPFAALGDGTHYLVDDYTLTVDPSASVLAFIGAKRKKTAPKMVALGNPSTKYPPLPFAEKEVTDIREVMGKTDVYLRERATETVGKEKFGEYAIIHLACHGRFDEKDPLGSALYLTSDGGNDGMLTASELFGLDLRRSSLVVLSACETGLSEVMKGDELIGLSRGFIFAGTPSLVVTLWEVADDSTGVLMVEFYRNLKGGMDKPEALRQAQLFLKSRPEFEHPFFWAPFVMIGDWE